MYEFLPLPPPYTHVHTHSYSLPQLSQEEQDKVERQRADKSLFAQELLLSTLVYSDSSSDSSDREET